MITLSSHLRLTASVLLAGLVLATSACSRSEPGMPEVVPEPTRQFSGGAVPPVGTPWQEAASWPRSQIVEVRVDGSGKGYILYAARNGEWARAKVREGRVSEIRPERPR